VPPPVAVNVILDVEQSKIVVDDVIEAVGKVVLKVIVVLAVAEQPFATVTTTVYVPAVVIVLVAVVVPSFHK
jgi:Na+/glutamate symporter